MTSRMIVLLGGVLLVPACVTVGKTVLVPGLEPRPLEEVRVFLPGDSVPPHERVAILEADFNDAMSDASDVINKLREETARLGGNGVMIVGSQAEGDAIRAMRTLTTGMYLGGRAKAQAFAILIDEEVESVEPAPTHAADDAVYRRPFPSPDDVITIDSADMATAGEGTLVRRLSAAVFALELKGRGSGFFITRDGLALTTIMSSRALTS